MECEASQGYFTEELKAIFRDEKTKNDRMTASISGLVRSSRDDGRMMRYLRDATFARAIFTRFDEIFMRFDTSSMP